MNHPCVECNCYNSILFEDGEVQCLLSLHLPDAVIRIYGGIGCDGFADTAEIMGEPIEQYQVFHVHTETGDRRPFRDTKPEPRDDAECRAAEYTRLWDGMPNRTSDRWTIKALLV